MDNEGVGKLASVLHQRTIETGEAHYGSLTLDFGVIGSDYSLTTNTFPIPIPKSDYLVLRQLTLGNTGDILTQTQKTSKSNSGAHKHNHSFTLAAATGGTVSGTISHTTDGNHVHDVLVPEKMRWLKPGDRVLVAWVQNDAVVIDIIRPATDIG